MKRPERKNYGIGEYGEIKYIDRLERYCSYLENKNQALQLQQTGVSGSTDIPKPYKWLKEEKWKIPQGTTYYDPKVTLTQCASWMMEYIAKYYR